MMGAEQPTDRAREHPLGNLELVRLPPGMRLGLAREHLRTAEAVQTAGHLDPRRQRGELLRQHLAPAVMILGATRQGQTQVPTTRRRLAEPWELPLPVP